MIEVIVCCITKHSIYYSTTTSMCTTDPIDYGWDQISNWCIHTKGDPILLLRSTLVHDVDPGDSLDMSTVISAFELDHFSPHNTCLKNVAPLNTISMLDDFAHITRRQYLDERFDTTIKLYSCRWLGEIPDWSVRSRGTIAHLLPAEACVDSGFETLSILWLKSGTWYAPRWSIKHRPFICFWTDPRLPA